MKTWMTIGLLAASVALTPAASVPARAADNNDWLGIAIGLGAVGALLYELNERDKKKEKKKKQAKAKAKAQTSRSRTSHDPVIRRDTARVGRHRELPAECIRQIETRGGLLREFVGEDCLERRGVRTARLPDWCQRVRDTRRGLREVYPVRCLQREGYVFRY